ncbi:unnamed protein product [Sphagnum jensenii]|uniref:Uncharacterized protein n=1 Tax=Sphagnum jensenii TaxID=128206 RepID=A0ABP0V9F7_9BRYO
MSEWSDIITPLLPVLYEILGTDGVAELRKDELNDFDYKTVQRRWLMTVFFPTIADEYGAWESVAPLPTSKLKEPGYMESFRATLGNDEDLAYLNMAFEGDDTHAAPAIATLDQMETMAQLAHPIYGLPLLARGFKQIAPQFASINIPDQTGEETRKEAIALSTKFENLAVEIANRATNGYDLAASLKAAKKDHPDYDEYERLFGLFSYLSAQGLAGEARREYALQMLPRLFDDQFENDRLFYAKFIPEQLINSPELFTEKEINELLTNCYGNAKKFPEWNHETDPNLIIPSSLERSMALGPLVQNAPIGVAKISAAWLNQLLGQKNIPEMSSWIDLMIFQLLNREEALIDHNAYGAYYKHDPADHMTLAGKYSTVPKLTVNEIKTLNDLGLKDYELYIYLSGVQTINKPPLTVSERTDRLGAFFEKATKMEVSKELWHKMLEETSNQVKASPPVTEQDKIPLRRLVAAVDSFSEFSDNTFDIVQPLLGNIRLAADYAFELDKRQDFGFDELKKLPARQNEHSHKIFNYFIPNFLLKADEAEFVPSEKLAGLFNGLHTASTDSPTYLLEDWDLLFKNIINVFTVEGSQAQKEALFVWSKAFLAQNPRSFSEMSDSVVLALFSRFPEKIEHPSLVKYVAGREQKMIDIISSRDEGRFKSDGRFDFVNADFDLLAELFDFKTANRVPLSHSAYAKKMVASLEISRPSQRSWLGQAFHFAQQMAGRDTKFGSEHLSALAYILTTIHDRAKVVDDKVRDKPSLSDLNKQIEIYFDGTELKHLMQFIGITNKLRLLSDYSDPDANVNAKKAMIDLFSIGNVNFHASAIKELIQILAGQAPNGRWIEESLHAVYTIDPQKFSPILHKQTLDFISKQSKSVLSIVNNILVAAKKQSPVVDHLLKLNPSLDQIEHNNLRNYLTHVQNPDLFLLDFYDANLITIANGNFDILAQLNDLAKLKQAVKTKGNPPINLKDVAGAIMNYLGSVNAPDLDPTSSISLKLAAILKEIGNIDLTQASKDDSQAISRLINVIDQIIPPQPVSNPLLINLNLLRMKIDFRGTPVENLSKAFGLLSDIKKFGRKSEILVDFIDRHLVRTTKITPDMFTKFLGEVDQQEASESAQDIVIAMLRKELRKTAADWLVKQKIGSRMTLAIFKLLSNGSSANPSLDYSSSNDLWNRMEAADQRESLPK